MDPKLRSEVDELAWRLHREHGHPEGYEGPCWGPTLAEQKEAMRRVAVAKMDALEKAIEEATAAPNDGRGHG